MTVDIQAFDKIVAEEVALMNSREEHTLEWQTYKHRVELLESIRATMSEPKVEAEVKHAKPAIEHKPLPELQTVTKETLVGGKNTEAKAKK